MRKEIILPLMVLSALVLTACGGGEKNTQSIISLTSILCIDGTPTITEITNYEKLLSGDTLVKDDANATVEIYAGSDGTKRVCLVDNGLNAHIVR
ncbi:hypothetical protein JHD49_04145 [Sulfurimonas sp. SAG-AH-194-C21]|nr:hypothetical protein [Sulfurimonas sp. SAG-AH-194-C21]MDF1883122.1 hypothetical protein [Sulfurimonas sp. SAG-AH-194-C21]